jgi:hypothetical protein
VSKSVITPGRESRMFLGSSDTAASFIAQDSGQKSPFVNLVSSLYMALAYLSLSLL